MKCNQCNQEITTSDNICAKCGKPALEKQIADSSTPITSIKICPECGYERKVSDKVPSWQCPSCKIAYHKHPNAQSSAKTPIPMSIDRRKKPRNQPVRHPFVIWFAVITLILLFLIFYFFR
jgi:uncharacterized membrane protein YvbJ